MTALHPTLVYAATHVQVALLGTTLLIWTLALAYQDRGRPADPRCAVLTGVLLSLLALTDPILALAGAGVAWAVVAPWVRPLDLRSVDLRLLSVVAAVVALAVVAPWLVAELRSFTANSWRSRARSDMPSGRATVRSAKERTRWSASRSSRSSVATEVRTDIKGLNRTLWEARHEAGYIDDIALSKD